MDSVDLSEPNLIAKKLLQDDLEATSRPVLLRNASNVQCTHFKPFVVL